MQSLFTSDFFSQNRTRLREQLDVNVIIIPANGLLQRGADSPYPFQQDANFRYLTGITEPDLTLVMDGSEEYLLLPSRSDTRQAFDGSVSIKDLQKVSGIRIVLEGSEGWTRLEQRLKKETQVAVPQVPPSYIEALGLYTNPARAALQARLKAWQPELKFIDAAAPLRKLRSVKQQPELAAIQKAIDITAATLDDITNERWDSYAHEYQVEADLSQGFRSRGAQGHAFDPIVAAGKRACTLHYVANDGRIGKGDLVVLDVGAAYEQYAADITRTKCVGQPTKRQREVYEAVLTAHQYACSLLKPGTILKDYEKAVHDFMGQQLQQLGLITENETERIRAYYPHATSHFLGLNVHDVGVYDEPLTADIVLTVEPGIYIPEEGIGVRIEDDVRITDNGIEILSEKLSRHL